MRTRYLTRCARRTTRPDTLSWARAYVAATPRSPLELRHQLMVADLLVQIGATR